MKSSSNILISMFSKWSKKSTRKRRLIGVTLNLLTIKIFWISLKRFFLLSP
ncbi:transmembrane protein, putative [Medicago truncatula]|uniref:Transmembrane protein, putative n=1 Tax=Medicago truncatula TaxID=3880 RepID=A0A072VWI6_MEDTR|nr:transmembrane protein, putative [Medicago truncatula]